MKTAFLLIALSLLLSACATLPPVNGTVANKDGRITLTPDGRIEIVIEPRSGK